MGQPQLKPPDRVTVGDFFAMSWPDDRRRQLVEGHIVAMAPPSRAHATLVVTLIQAIGPVLADCCELLTEAGLAPLTREHTCYEVDLLVTCEPPEPRQRVIRAPILLVEVLSPTTQSFDRNQKLSDYRKIPSVREILFVDSEHMVVELYRRVDGNRWLSELLNTPADVLHLDSVGLDITLAELYRRVVFSLEASVASSS